jgi:hypothetical protein
MSHMQFVHGSYVPMAMKSVVGGAPFALSMIASRLVNDISGQITTSHSS